jgi:hypothetical protein
MKIIHIYNYFEIKTKLYIFCSMVLVLLGLSAQAQEHPPRPLQVSLYQNLSFGAVIQGTIGGQIIIDPQGFRTVSGDIIPVFLSYSYYPAIFNVEAIPGSIITIVNGPDITLTGSNGGTLLMKIGPSIPGSPFVATQTPPLRNEVRIGGTLFISNSAANPAGNYIGTFSVTFIQQ